MKNFRLGVWGYIRIYPHEKKMQKYLEVSNFLLYISSGFCSSRLLIVSNMARLFHRDFEHRLKNLAFAINDALIFEKEANLFPFLYQVYAYIWSHGIDGCRLSSNPNKEKR